MKWKFEMGEIDNNYLLDLMYGRKELTCMNCPVKYCSPEEKSCQQALLEFAAERMEEMIVCLDGRRWY